MQTAEEPRKANQRENMFIHHLAVWTSNLERLSEFYQIYFNAQAGPLYRNPAKNFTSCFLTFQNGTKLEIMSNPAVDRQNEATSQPAIGLAHFAISTGSVEQVDALTLRLQQDGHTLAGSPRWTGDGYYESVILDPDGNRVEITV